MSKFYGPTADRRQQRQSEMPLFRKKQQQRHADCLKQQMKCGLELLESACAGDEPRVEQLLNGNVTLLLDEDGRTALHLAAMNGHSRIVRLLLDTGAVNPNGTDKWGYTPLQRACVAGHAEVARLLVEYAECDTDAVDNVQENTAVHEAAFYGCQSLVKLLLDNQANFNKRNKAGATALHLACQKGRNTCVRLLLQAGCRADVRDNYDDTALHAAVRQLHANTAKLLLTKGGADPNHQNKNGDTAAHIACNLAQKKVVRLLVEHGARLDVSNKHGDTPYDIAARKNCPELTEALLRGSRRRRNGAEDGTFEREKMSKERRIKIRRRLEAVRRVEDDSCWRVLFEDGPKVDAGLRDGRQYFIDLSGRLHKVHKEELRRAPKPDDRGHNHKCCCEPFLRRLAERTGTSHRKLLKEIDACHDELTGHRDDEERCCYEKLTKAELHKELMRRASPSFSSVSRHDSKTTGASKRTVSLKCNRLRRAKSETEMSQGSPSASDSDPSDEHERAFGVVAVEPPTRSQQPSLADPPQPPPPSAQMVRSLLQESCRRTMNEFNRMELDDSCTTPSSSNYSRRFVSSSTSADRTEGEDEDDEYEQQQRRPLADDEEEEDYRRTNAGGGPSLDSGYGTSGASPLSFLPSVPQQSLRDSATQTSRICEYDSVCAEENVYDELDSFLAGSSDRNRDVAPPIRLTIPPPPRQPPPPLPIRR